MARNRWGQEIPEPRVHDNPTPAYSDSGLVDRFGRKLVREKVVGFKQDGIAGSNPVPCSNTDGEV